ncbi:MAG TPA: ABC transporter permease [Vicinamibacterales bacterium]|jgi:predicted permease
MNVRDLFLRIRALVARRRVEQELDDELSFHIERETRKQVAAGLSPADARARAIALFGPVPLAADQCRDARRVGLVDDLVRDILYALRTLRRAPLAALTIVATVALGLGLVTAVFAIYNVFLLRVDAVQSPRELFAVGVGQRTVGYYESNIALTRRDYEAMRRETSVFADAFAMNGVAWRMEGRLTRASLVTGNFFQVLGVQAALGRPLVPSDDERSGGRPVIVLSHAGWLKLLQGDAAVIGRRVVIDGAPYEIVGVMPDGFRGLEITPPDFWAPLSLGEFHDTNAGRADIAVEVVGRLKQAMSRQAATAALAVWASGRTEFQKGTERQIPVLLTPKQGTLSWNALTGLMIFSPIFFAFGLILMIGCANVANLLLARGVSRQREIGIRLSLGASRQRIIRQLLTESLLLGLAAAAGALVVSRLFLGSALAAAMTTIPAEFIQFVTVLNLAAPSADWRVCTFVVAGAVVSTALFGLIPALHATRLEVVRTMRGEVVRDARPRRARHILIVVQVGASALLLIGAAIFLRGAFTAATQDPGVRTRDTLRVSIETEERRVTILQDLRTHPSVAVVAASSRPTKAVIETSVSQPSRMSVDQLAVSSEYFSVVGLELVNGRSFTPSERTADAGVVVVSQSLARQLWPTDSGVGQVVRLEEPSSPRDAPRSLARRTLTVIGIVRDPGRASGMSVRGVYLPTGPETPETRLFLRVRGNVDQVRLALLERLVGLDPAFGVMTLGNGMEIAGLQIGFGLTVVLGGLALALTVSGLFSVLSYLVEQQAKEIGVRMALGATALGVARLVLTHSLRPAGVGLAAGTGLAAAVAIVLMATPAASEIGGTINVFDPLAYAASVLVIATACVIAVSVPTLRAARLDPIAILRKD